MIHALTVEVDGRNNVAQGSITVRFARFDGSCHEYEYTIKDASGNVLANGSDLRSGSAPYPGEVRVDHAGIMATLCGFIDAFADSKPGMPNYGLFPEVMRPWAECYCEELVLIANELDNADSKAGR